MGNRTARLILSSAVVLLAFAATLSAGEGQEAIDFQPEGFGSNSRGGEGGRAIIREVRERTGSVGRRSGGNAQ